LALNDSYPQHVVTAVIVAHDGAAWLPHVIDALLEQDRPVQRVVAVDTGSRDRSGAVLAAKLGQAVVFGMDRGTGYGAAVSRALQHKAASVSVPAPAGPAGAERVEWVWLLHDDCEPAPDALEQLLRGAAESPAAGVLGPKVMDWSDRSVIVEAGVTIDAVGRRVTGIEPREVDQGQHDGDRDVLAVGSAGMLIRRDVWDRTGGFDTGMALFREDVDLCWRVHAAGYRVRLITDAVVFHAQAAARRRRPVSAGRRAPYLDRRNALMTLLGNLPFAAMLGSIARNAATSFFRTLYLLLAKRPAAALDEAAAVAAVLGHPLRLRRTRQRRAPGRRAAYNRLRADLPAGKSVREMAEFAASALSRSPQLDTAGMHHATDDPNDDDFLLTDIGIVQRFMTHPGVLLFVGLAIVAGIAERSLLRSGPLGGGALLPAWGGASGLWREYWQAFHPNGVGSSATAPPYLALVAGLATVLGGKPWLAVDVILLGCVPLAGVTAFLAAGRVTRSAPVRVWAAAAYALLPVATGAIAAGRLGTAVVFVLLPLIGLSAGRMLTRPHQLARRAAWATGLLVAVGAAFAPVLWLMTLVAAAAALIAFRASRRGLLANLAIVVIVPPALLFPWSLQLAAHPSGLLLEAGVQQAGLAAPDLPARSLMLLSPGGPGLPPAWVTAGLALAALAALLASRQRGAIMAGWFVAVLGLAAALAVSRVAVTPAGGGAAVPGWPGVALAAAAAGLLLAAAAGSESLTGLAAAGGRSGLRRLISGRGLLVALLAAAAISAPVLAAVTWISSGVRGPVAPAAGQAAPELVSALPDNGLQQRTLVLRSAGGRIFFLLLRDSVPGLGDSELTPVPAAQRALTAAVAGLVAQNGGEAANLQQELARFDIGYVLMQAPVNQALASTLDGVAGLHPVNLAQSFDLWRLDNPTSEVTVLQPGGSTVAVPSGWVGASGSRAPASGGILELAEPRGGWSATLNGHPLTAVASPAGSWAQAFRLPAGGGTLDISRSQPGHDLAIAAEALAAVVVAALALPGVHTAAETQEAAPAPAAGRAAAEARGAAEAGTADAGGSIPAGPGTEGDAAAGPADASGRRRDSRIPGRGGRAGARAHGSRPGRAARSRPRRPAPSADGPRVPRQAGPPEQGGPPPAVREADQLAWPADQPAAGGAAWPGRDGAVGAPPAAPGQGRDGRAERQGAAAQRAAPWSHPAGQPDRGRHTAGRPDRGRPQQAREDPARTANGRAAPDGQVPRQPAAPPSSWPASDQPSSWPSAASPSGSADRPGSRPDSADSAGWPAAGEPGQRAGQELEPLPPAGEQPRDWPRPAADDRSAHRWPAPDRDREGDSR